MLSNDLGEVASRAQESIESVKEPGETVVWQVMIMPADFL